MVILKNLKISYKGNAFSLIKIPNETPCLSVNKMFKREKNIPNKIVEDNLKI